LAFATARSSVFVCEATAALVFPDGLDRAINFLWLVSLPVSSMLAPNPWQTGLTAKRWPGGDGIGPVLH